MTDRDPGTQHVRAAHIAGVSGRERAAILAAIAIIGAIVVWLAMTGRPDEIDRTARPSPLAVSTGQSPAAVSPAAARNAEWAANALDHRGSIGMGYDYECPADGSPGIIWGTFVYLDASSVCTAAVHHGVISVESGGTVRIVVQSGQDQYAGSLRNGIRSESYGSFFGSFGIVGPASPPQSVEPYPPASASPAPSDPAGGPTEPGTPLADGPWVAGAMDHRESLDQEFEYECPPDGFPAAVWGTGTYTDDSSVCTAAVHAGLISLEKGGLVTIVIRRGQGGYGGSLQNGIRTQDWAEPWGGSFQFVDP